MSSVLEIKMDCLAFGAGLKVRKRKTCARVRAAGLCCPYSLSRGFVEDGIKR